MSATQKILRELIGFPTVSRDSNLQLIEYIRTYLQQWGIDCHLTHNEAQTKANLYAVFGPGKSGGVMLSGHTDVVPVEGQAWTMDPFTLTEKDEQLYGRGTTDMKGFIAAVLAMIPQAMQCRLKQPIHLAFSYDEEIGCVGVRRMIDLLESAPERPGFCIIGEPTSLNVGIAHKGKTGVICRCHGVEAHSALATKGINAIYLATEMIQEIRLIQQRIQDHGNKDNGFMVPYSTLHVGTIEGGTALNIIPNLCEFKFEVRNLKADDPCQIMQKITEAAKRVSAQYQTNFPQVSIEVDVFNAYPALDTDVESEIVDFVRTLASDSDVVKLDFGTEGGLFQQRLSVPTVVCGPGSMDQGHKPDEFIRKSELQRCDRFLGKLLAQLSQ